MTKEPIITPTSQSSGLTHGLNPTGESSLVKILGDPKQWREGLNGVNSYVFTKDRPRRKYKTKVLGLGRRVRCHGSACRSEKTRRDWP